MNFIIHDIPSFEPPRGEEKYIVFDANQKYAFCKGCFDCWLRTPGKCSMKDKVHGLADNLSDCDRFTIVSRALYGGFSTEIKGVVDRLIAFNLPFFKKINGELHHKPRYNNPFELQVIFYGDCTEDEKRTALEYVSNIALNFNGVKSSVKFVECAEQVGGAL